MLLYRSLLQLRKTQVLAVNNANNVKQTVMKQMSHSFHNSSFQLNNAKETSVDGGMSGANEGTKVNLNLATPTETFYANTAVDLVTIPGLVGEYGVTASHTPIISQMKPGVIAVHLSSDNKNDGKIEYFFTSGGFAFTHANSTTDLACVELIKVADLDATLATTGLEEAKMELAAATDGSAEKVNATIAIETYQAIISAVGRINVTVEATSN